MCLWQCLHGNGNNGFDVSVFTWCGNDDFVIAFLHGNGNAGFDDGVLHKRHYITLCLFHSAKLKTYPFVN